MDDFRPATNTHEIAKKWTELKKSEQVEQAAIYILGNGEKTLKKSGTDIFSEYRAFFDQEAPIAERTFRQYLSNLSGSENSRIVRVDGRHLYTLAAEHVIESPEAESVSDQSSLTMQEEKPQRLAREQAMYEMLVNWVDTRKYQAGDISANTANGKWGNPDILGVKLLQTLDGHRVELLSIEAKTSDSDWRQFFFEAVSHRRFCDRVYYCFAAEDDTYKVDNDMKYYSELFSVGILIMRFEPKAYKVFQEKAEIPDPEQVKIEEYLSAPQNHPPAELKFRFLANLKLNDIPKISQFGLKS